MWLHVPPDVTQNSAILPSVCLCVSYGSWNEWLVSSASTINKRSLQAYCRRIAFGKWTMKWYIQPGRFSPAYPFGALGSVPDQSMYDLCLTIWHWERVSFEDFGIAQSVSLHQCSTLILLLVLTCQKDKLAQPGSLQTNAVSTQRTAPYEQVLLTFRHRASCIHVQGQAFHYSPENAFYIFNQQIYFII